MKIKANDIEKSLKYQKANLTESVEKPKYILTNVLASNPKTKDSINQRIYELSIERKSRKLPDT